MRRGMWDKTSPLERDMRAGRLGGGGLQQPGYQQHVQRQRRGRDTSSGVLQRLLSLHRPLSVRGRVDGTPTVGDLWWQWPGCAGNVKHLIPILSRNPAL